MNNIENKLKMYSSFNFIFITVLLFLVEYESVDVTRNLGCYEDNDGDTSISEKHFGDSPRQLTSTLCINECAIYKYPYAAVKNGTSCYCSSLAPPSYRQVNETRGCTLKCPGNNTELCGGSWAYSVYRTNVIDRSLSQGFYYVGCFDNDNTICNENGYSIEINNLSPFMCQEICYKKGFLYFGIEQGTKCTCKDQFETRKTFAENCNNSCSVVGSGNTTCSGKSKTSVYATSITDYPVEELEIGCFAIDLNCQNILSNLSFELSKTNSPRRCMNLCMQKGYNYSGVSFVTECHCFNYDPTENFIKINHILCHSECPGDLSQSCAQGKSMLIYRIQTISHDSSKSQYVGCYKFNKAVKEFDHYEISSTHVKTLEDCTESCASKKFLYAVILNRKLCTCLHSPLSIYSKVSDKECANEDFRVDEGLFPNNIPDYRIAVYRTGVSYMSSKPTSAYDSCTLNMNFVKEYKKLVSNLDPNVCHNICYKKGFLYFGLFNRIECLCGKVKTLRSFDENSCTDICPGNPFAQCGSSSHVSVYITGIPDYDTYTFEYGYQVETCINTSTFPIIIPDTNSPRRCFNMCFLRGYAHFAVGNRIECHCMKELPKNVSEISQTPCGLSCPGDENELCGDQNLLNLYSYKAPADVTRFGGQDDNDVTLKSGETTKITWTGTGTPVSAKSEMKPCNDSITTVEGVSACKSQIIFYDAFESLNLMRWMNVVKMAWNPGYEFVLYSDSRSNSYVQNGSLVLKPTIRQKYIETGKLEMENCTGVPGSEECTRQAQGYLILPPIASARITTEKTFTFKYGIVTVTAKMPRGDWILPEIWLQPVGDNNPEEAIKLSFARGNEHYQCYGDDIGVNRLESGYCTSGYNTEACPFVFQNGLNEDYHNFTFEWKPDKMEMIVDGTRTLNIKSEKGIPAKEHYLILGVSVGGIKEFPDNCTTSDWTTKPWGNTNPKALLNFWQKSENWRKTWINDDVALKISEIKVTSI